MKRVASFSIIFFLILLAISSCNKESIEGNTGVEDEDITSSNSSLSLEEAAYNQILGNIVNTDTLGNITSIMIGEVLNLTTPNVYSVGADSLEEAKEFLYSEILNLVDSSLITGLGSDNITVSLGENGLLKFAPASGDGSDGIYATLTIELADLPELEVINFCSRSYFTTNSTGAEIKSGYVYQNSKGQNYFCIIPTTEGRTGVLVRLYHQQKGISKIVFKNGENSGNSIDWYVTIASGHPSAAEWDAIQYAYYNANGRFKTFCTSINFNYSVLTSREHPVGTTRAVEFYESNSWTKRGGFLNLVTYTYFKDFTGYHIFSNLYYFSQQRSGEYNFDTHWWQSAEKRTYCYRKSFYLDDYKIWVERVTFKHSDSMDDWTKIKM